MNKSKLLYWTDVGMGLSFLVVFITGIIKLEHPREVMFLHDWSGVLMGIFVLLHLILHLKWIFVMTKGLIIQGEVKK